MRKLEKAGPTKKLVYDVISVQMSLLDLLRLWHGGEDRGEAKCNPFLMLHRHSDRSSAPAGCTGRNLRRAILMVETCKMAQYPFSGTQPIQDLDWEMYLKETANQIVQEPQKAE